MILGEHTIGIIEIKNQKVLNSQKNLRDIILKAFTTCGLNVVEEKYHIFDNPKAITYCFILSQSHFIIHTWPEESKLLFDLFTCTNNKNSRECIKVLAEQLNGNIISMKKLKI